MSTITPQQRSVHKSHEVFGGREKKEERSPVFHPKWKIVGDGHLTDVVDRRMIGVRRGDLTSPKGNRKPYWKLLGKHFKGVCKDITI